MLLYAVLIMAGYLAGSLASALIVCRCMGLPDPRSHGSGNPGATNVLRLHGRRAAVYTLAGDMMKGFVPVIAAGLLHAPAWVIALTGVAAFTGHLYPLYFGFQGGKGVATLIGVLAGSSWFLGAAFIGTWLGVAALTRYSSLAALTAAALTPLYTWLLLGDAAYVICFSILSVLVVLRHRANIRNLINGTEGKIGADAV